MSKKDIIFILKLLFYWNVILTILLATCYIRQGDKITIPTTIELEEITPDKNGVYTWN